SASKIIQINGNQRSISIAGYVDPKYINNGEIFSNRLADAVISIRADYIKDELSISPRILSEDEKASADLTEEEKQQMIIYFLNNLLGEFFK
ncbi:MAG: flagellar basal body L-ring protein FlgH, partial [Actinomycetia bacterium]|nr:flagellar basal body L-ring protein FlgH [Actinomycetes bacterium]